MKIIDVVAAVIVDDDGKILIAKRKKGKTLENYWEFPGGNFKGFDDQEGFLCREQGAADHGARDGRQHDGAKGGE